MFLDSKGKLLLHPMSVEVQYDVVWNQRTDACNCH